MTPMAAFQTAVIVGCLFIMFRRDKASRAATRAWVRHPRTIRRLAQERQAVSDTGFERLQIRDESIHAC